MPEASESPELETGFLLPIERKANKNGFKKPGFSHSAGPSTEFFALSLPLPGQKRAPKTQFI